MTEQEKKDLEWASSFYLYDDTLDVAIEVIQDFLNCDPLDLGRLQGNTYNTIYNIEKEIDND